MGRKAEGIRVGLPHAVSGIDKGRGKERRRGAQIVISIGRDAIHDSRTQAGECSIEDSITGANTRLPGVAEKGLQDSIAEMRRIREADPRRKTAIFGRGES